MAPKERNLKILLYTHALSGGGAERALALLASGLHERGLDVILVVDYIAQGNEGYVHPDVRRKTIGGNHLISVVRLARLLAVEKPDVSFSALCCSNLKHFIAAGLVGRLDRSIISYHGFYESEQQFLSRVSYLLTPLLTRAASHTLAVSNALRFNLVEKWRASRSRTSLIYNPVVWGERQPELTHDILKSRAPMVLAIGRLIPLKNFDGLIRSFARVSPAHARLVILGEGPERQHLEFEIERLGLIGRVDLPGYAQAPWSYYARATCFVVSSRTESFGMTVVEALAHGLPVVSTDCGGPPEILRGNDDGKVVPLDDENALTEAIIAALADPGQPSPRMRSADRFAVPVAIDAYAALIHQVTARAKSRTLTAGFV